MIKNPSNKVTVPQAVQAMHELMLWFIPQLDKLPRQRRYTLGARLETGCIDILEVLIEATYGQHKRHVLTQANRKLELLRHLWQLCYELKTISNETYEHGATLCNDLGEQLSASFF